MRDHRDCRNDVAIDDLSAFANSFWEWWCGLQPRHTISDVSGTFVSRFDDTWTWAVLDMPGSAGLVLVMMALSWWGSALINDLNHDPGLSLMWDRAVRDVAYALEELVQWKDDRLVAEGNDDNVSSSDLLSGGLGDESISASSAHTAKPRQRNGSLSQSRELATPKDAEVRVSTRLKTAYVFLILFAVSYRILIFWTLVYGRRRERPKTRSSNRRDSRKGGGSTARTSIDYYTLLVLLGTVIDRCITADCIIPDCVWMNVGGMVFWDDIVHHGPHRAPQHRNTI